MSLLHGILDLFQDELDGPPTVGEFLEVISRSVPSRTDAIDFPGGSWTLTAKLAPGHRRRRGSRVADLNDAVFVEATDWLSALAEAVMAGTGRPATSRELATAIRDALAASGVVFADVPASAVVGLSAAPSRKRTRLDRGDVIAIPGAAGRYHLGVVVAPRDRMGMALGILRGLHEQPALEPSARYEARPKPNPVHTGPELIANGTWPIVGHDEELLALFPDEPEIYHSPEFAFPGIPIGPFGSAETASGRMRDISEAEAEQVGLTDRTYCQTHLAEVLHLLLDAQES